MKKTSLHFPSISVREIIEVIEKRASPKNNTSGTQLRSGLDVALNLRWIEYMCVMITCYRVLSLKFIEIHFAFNMASVKNKIGYPAMKITFLLSDLNLSRIKVTSHLHGCPSKLYVGGKLNNCSLRWKYNLSGFFCQEVSGAGKVWNDWGLFYSIYRVSDATARAKWLHSLIHKASINYHVPSLFDILIGCPDIGI